MEKKVFKHEPPNLVLEKAETKQPVADLDIGVIIRNDLKAEGRTVVWLAEKIGMCRPNFYYHLRNCDFSLDQLYQISLALNKNYMKPYSEVIERRIGRPKRSRA